MKNFGPDIGLFIVDNYNKLQTYPISGQTILLLTDMDFVYILIPMFGFENAERLSTICEQQRRINLKHQEIKVTFDV